jgi:GNAT superfamily N-acetyltransferase
MTNSFNHFSITPALISDCSDCARLLVEQLSEHGIVVSAKHLRGVLECAIVDPSRGFVLLARTNDQAVGIAYVATTLSVEHCGIVAWLEELYVTPDHRERGIGTALVHAALDRARDNGIVAMDLEIDLAHSLVASLYQRFGFRPLERSRWVKDLKS